MSYAVPLPSIGTFAAWRNAARGLIGNGVPGSGIAWTFEGAAPSLFDANDAPLPRERGEVRVPKSFPALAEKVCAHSNPDRFALLYEALARLQTAPRLLEDRSDAMVARLGEMEKSVRRDMHKMKAFLRFREGPGEGGRRRFAAWFEPQHNILELTAPFFTRRFGDMDWIIHTPGMAARFIDGELTLEAGPQERPALDDATEELWKTYFANIFNPARLKVKAMCAEMPRKYWHNMPEAELIPGLIADAEARSRAMQQAMPSLPPLRAERIAHRRAPATPPEASDCPASLDALRRAAQGCTRCPLHCNATQTVFGEGPDDAALMIVGEQPGDQEDLVGRPFVGPAGQLFDRLAAKAGLDRSESYVTNAVKHFKFVPRGKRRLHQRPTAGEVDHCRWWLGQEIAQVKPQLVLALGATALRALTGSGDDITRRRGQVEAGRDGIPVFVALHPSALLRTRDAAARERAEAVFISDLARAASLVKSGSNLPGTAALSK